MIAKAMPRIDNQALIRKCSPDCGRLHHLRGHQVIPVAQVVLVIVGAVARQDHVDLIGPVDDVVVTQAIFA